MNDIVQIISFILRIITPIAGIAIAVICFFSLRYGRREKRALIALDDTNNNIRYPVLYWENSIGRSKSSDIIIPDLTVSREHAVLLRRDDGWYITDTGSKAGVFVNDEQTSGRHPVYVGDRITLGTTVLTLHRADDPTEANVRQKMIPPKTHSTLPGALLVSLLTVYILMLGIQGMLNMGSLVILPNVLIFIGLSWLFMILTRVIFKRRNFELDTLALLLCGSGAVLAAVHDTRQGYVQLVSILLGYVVYCFMLWFIEIPDRVTKWRIIIYILDVGMLASTLIIGSTVNGAKNWIVIGPLMIQPSELAKIAYIFVGAATLDQLQTKKNLLGFILLSGACIVLLFLMSDFGTALIFFVTFLIIAFMRSGSFKTIIFAVTAAVLGVVVILTIKPYIANRFMAWGHVWEYADSLGYQQVNSFIYSASGGLFGTGLSNGNLQYLFASENDLVFGLVSEEMGLISALFFAAVIGGFMIYAKGVSTRSRSTFYSISACTAGGLLVFQSMLNIFGVTDILPLTGVTLPFISYGGSSMISCWGLLAFIKAADERTYHRPEKPAPKEE